MPYTLLEHGKALAERHRAAAAPLLPQAALPEALQRGLDRAGWLRVLGGCGRAAKTLARLLWGPRWRQRLDGRPWGLGRAARLLGSLPQAPLADRALIRLLQDLEARRIPSTAAAGDPPPGAPSASPGLPQSPPNDPAAVSTPDRSGARVLFFRGCANAGLLSGSSRRLLELLRRSGCDVRIPRGQTCCGALAAHAGRPGRAEDLRRRNDRAFAAAAQGKAQTWVVAEAAGCGLHLREGRPPGERDVGAVGAVVDAVVALDRLTLPPLRPVFLTVAFHDPCHLRHGQGVWTEPRRLLARIPGLTVVEPCEPEVCCGSGGAWGLRHPDLSADLGRRKARNLAATGADLILTTNPGCLGQIQDGLAVQASGIPILPLTDLLWYACSARNRPGIGPESGDLPGIAP